MAKKTEQKKSKFADIIGLIMQPVANFFGEVIKGKAIDIKESALDALYKFKSQIFRSLVEGFLLLVGLGALIVGLILYLSRYLSIDLLLLAFGLIVILIVLFTAKLKR